MKKRPSTIALVLLMAFAGGCNDGAQGPPGINGRDGSPRAIKVLVMGTQSDALLKDLVIAFSSFSGIPAGSVVDHTDVTANVPSLSTLQQYDAVLVFTVNAPTDAVALGDRLAAYADAGGGVVIGQGAFTTPNHLQGFIMDAGYSPFKAGSPFPIATVRHG